MIVVCDTCYQEVDPAVTVHTHPGPVDCDPGGVTVPAIAIVLVRLLRRGER